MASYLEIVQNNLWDQQLFRNHFFFFLMSNWTKLSFYDSLADIVRFY